MKNLAKHLVSGNTPQTKPMFGKKQIKNNAGGYVFEVDKWTQLRRFLILGSSGGTYYVAERELTGENAEVILSCYREDASRTLKVIEEVSVSGLAPKVTYALFALALSMFQDLEVNSEERRATFDKVVRTGSHFFEFVKYCDTIRGWGSSLKKIAQHWYLNKERDQLVYQLAKYRNREGWTHKDVLKKCHVHANKPNNDLRAWVVNGTLPDPMPRLIEGMEKLKGDTTAEVAAQVIRDYRLTHEMVPTELQAKTEVLEALLEGMPLGATIRQLARLTKAGVLKANNSYTKLVNERLLNEEGIERSRIHPMNYLLALMTYRRGGATVGLYGRTSGLTFAPVPSICDSLEEGFYKAFKNVEPAGANYLIGVDVSGSMGWGETAGSRGIMPSEAAAACAMVTVQSERDVLTYGFSTNFVNLEFRKRTSITEALDTTRRMTMGGTDCALPMQYATKNKLDVDAFVVYTDNETWHGRQHPVEALAEYNQKMGRDAKLIVQAFSPTKFSIADPANPNMLDVVGMDASTPQTLSNFVGNRL